MEHYSKIHSNTGQKSTPIWPCYDNDYKSTSQESLKLLHVYFNLIIYLL